MRHNVIYAIRHIESGRMYVGSAVDFVKRQRLHRNELRRGTHHSPKLQRAWNKYGEDAFVFEVLEGVADKSQLIPREQHWIDHHCAAAKGYNIRVTAGSFLGMRHSDATRAKMFLARIGMPPPSEETRQKISAAKKGKKHAPEVGRKHSAKMMGRTPTAEHSARRNAALRSAEVRAKISASSKGRVKTPEHMEKIRQALARPDVKAKMVGRRGPNTGKAMSPETKERMRQAALARWQDPELRAKFVAIRQARAPRDGSKK